MTRSKTHGVEMDEKKKKEPVVLPEDESREYDTKTLSCLDDARFSAACREAWVFQISCWLAIGGILGLAWLLCPEDTAGVTAALGMPVWYVAGAAALGLVFVLWTYFCSRFGNNMLLDAREEESAWKR